jgi:hypothetical protein
MARRGASHAPKRGMPEEPWGDGTQHWQYPQATAQWSEQGPQQVHGYNGYNQPPPTLVQQPQRQPYLDYSTPQAYDPPEAYRDHQAHTGPGMGTAVLSQPTRLGFGQLIPARVLPHADPARLKAPPYLYHLGLGLILLVQAVFSMKLVFSNGAFGDEGLYLLDGRLEWAHWLHGAPLGPLNASGAPQIYPPLGALANDVGGLIGARILSLLFMLGATALLYAMGTRLFGHGAALAAAGLWAVTEPVLRLAFATFDPLSCLLVVLSAWMAVRAAAIHRRIFQLLMVAGSGAVLALAAVTAESFAIMIPVVPGISLLAWANYFSWKRAFLLTAVQTMTVVGLAAGGLTVLGLWHDAIHSTLSRKRGLGQGVSLVISSAWKWDEVLFALAVLATIGVFVTKKWHPEALLVAACMLAGTVVPIYQAHIGTTWSLDKHMSAGSAFAALAAGYGVARARAWFLASPRVAAGIMAAVLAYPALGGLSQGQSVFNTWVNLKPMVDAAEPYATGTAPALDNSANGHLNSNILAYYMPSTNWAGVTKATSKLIATGGYSVIASDQPFTPSEAADAQKAAGKSNVAFRNYIMSVVGKRSIINDIESSYRYAIVSVLPYDIPGPNNIGAFLVWRATPLQPGAPAPKVKHHHRKHHHAALQVEHYETFYYQQVTFPIYPLYTHVSWLLTVVLPGSLRGGPSILGRYWWVPIIRSRPWTLRRRRRGQFPELRLARSLSAISGARRRTRSHCSGEGVRPRCRPCSTVTAS